MSYLIHAAAFCGFVAQQAMMIIPAIKDDDNTPNKFSFKFYFSRPRNVVMLVLNTAATIGMMLAHSELVMLMVKVPYVGPYFEGTALPILTSLLTGFGSAWVFRWLASKMA